MKPSKLKTRRQWNSTLPAPTKPLSRSSQKTKTRKPIPKVNLKAKARRDASYRKYMGSKEWKALRLKVFERDGFRCIYKRPWDPRIESLDEYAEMSDARLRCTEVDESRTGRGLICDHLTYARFRHELLTDLRTLCKNHNAHLTVSGRANWAQPGRRN